MMIKGAYSEKYKSIQHEKLGKLKDQVRTEGQNLHDRARELSRETNRRRKTLEDKKRQREQEEEEERAAVLAERSKAKQEATQKFQKNALNKHKALPSRRIEQTTDSPVIQDGIRVVQGHAVEIKIGEQITATDPPLVEALELVHNPDAFTSPGSHNLQHYGPNVAYGAVNGFSPFGYYGDPAMDQGHNYAHMDMDSNGTQITKVFGGHNASNWGLQSMEPDVLSFEEQERLRQDALQNSGPRLAFINEAQECTDGALPPTMGRDSPAGSLTSLDSLDEIPQETTASATRKIPSQIGAVTAIITKGSKVKSAGRRRVTFSDSIEFDDGLTGQLVTAEKESCKHYVNLYHSRVAAANNADYSTSTFATSRSSTNLTPAAQAASNAVSGEQGHGNKKSTPSSGAPGCSPARKTGMSSVSNPIPGSSTSMVVPMSVYSQIKATGSHPVATVGESTSSAITHSDHPTQHVALGSFGKRNVSYMRNDIAEAGNSNIRIGRDQESTNGIPTKEEDTYPDLVDSLDLVHDSLDEMDVDGGSMEDRLVENRKYEHTAGQDTSNTEINDLQKRLSDGTSRDLQMDSPQTVENDIVVPVVDYYGNPATIYHHPFGEKIASHDAPQFCGVSSHQSTSPVAYHFGESDSLATRGDTHSFNHERLASKELSKSGSVVPSSGHSGQVLSSDVNQPEPQINSLSRNESLYGGSPVLAASSSESHQGYRIPTQPPYYRSWYSGSFFPTRADNVGTEQVNQMICQGKGIEEGNHVRHDAQEVLGVQEKLQHEGSPFQKKTKSGAAGHSVVTAKPPNPSLRVKGALRSSPLHRKRAAAAVRHAAGRQSLATEKTQKHINQKKPGTSKEKDNKGSNNVHNDRKTRIALNKDHDAQSIRRRDSNSGSDDDEFIKSIKRNMERINMRTNASPAQDENQKVIDAISYRPKANSHIGTESPDIQINGLFGDDLEDNFRREDRYGQTVGTARKIHPPRIASARGRSRQDTPNMGPASQTANIVSRGTSPLHGFSPSLGATPHRGTAGNRMMVKSVQNRSPDQNSAFSVSNGNASHSQTGVNNYAAGSGMHTSSGWTKSSASHHPSPDPQGHSNPQIVNLKRSISLDKTPTDDEINVLWDRVRSCLDQKESQSVGSDSCVNRIDVRRSRTHSGPFVPQPYSGQISRDVEGPSLLSGHSGATPGVGTIGGLRRYGSYEVLRRYDSADNLGYRRPPLLQQRAQRTRHSSHGKPPMVPRQQPHSPVSSKQGPLTTMSTRASVSGPHPLSQNELRAVLTASEKTQERLHREQRDQMMEQVQLLQYQAMMNGRRGPSALSIEEQRLMQSLDMLNERLQAQEAIAANLNQQQKGSKAEQRTYSAQPRQASRHQRSSSATHKHRTLQADSPAH